MTVSARLVLIPLLAWAACVPAVAQAPATQPARDDAAVRRLQTLFNDLAHHDGDVRERAREQLMGMSRSELELFRGVVERARPLLPAQATALREIVLQAFLAAEPYPADRNIGFLGVQLADAAMDDDPATQHGVLITGRISGFCGYRMLRTGDVILRVMQHPEAPLRSHNHLAALIQTFPAGAEVELEVLRRGRVLRIPLKLDARPLELRESFDLDNFQWRRDDRFHTYWQRTFAPLVDEAVS